MMCSSL